LRRLFSSFARGWPGAGLLLLRLIAATALTHQGIATLSGENSVHPLLSAAIPIMAAILLTVGLWTPIAGAITAVMQLWNLYAGAGDFWFHIFLGTLGVALALLGPGAWSVDARLFGWKRIDIQDPQS
jgi:putative oxidoreductase